MKKPKFKFVKQEEECGCAIACIAMILGKSYDEIRKSFKGDFQKDGIETEKSLYYLSENGVDTIRKMPYGYVDREASNLRMIKPFADIHFVSIKQFSNSNSNHALVMLKNGQFVCPTVNKKMEEVAVYEICEVVGCYYDK